MKRSILLVLSIVLPVLSCIGREQTTDLRSLHREERDRYARHVEADLRENILPFWLEHARDRKRGGFFGQMNDGTGIEEDATRGALLTTRILWTFSAAYQRYPNPEYLEMARWAYEDLLARFWDKENGGLFWSIRADGAPLDTRKLIYVQSFGIYSLAEFHRATGDRQPLDHAIALYRVVEKHSRDRGNSGYFEEFSRDWTKSMERGAKGSAMGSLGQKSQNVHLHLLEAYTNLLRAWPDQQLRQDLSGLVDVLLGRIVDPSRHQLRLFFTENWSPLSDVVSYGHDIEFSWLLVEAAEVLGDHALVRRARDEAVKIAAVTLSEGVDKDGAVLAEGDAGGVINTAKDWWPQAEAAVGFFNAFEVSGDVAYLNASLKSWDFIERSLIDRKGGEWFVGVSKDGRVLSPVKFSFWKCPYHNGRACMELLDRLKAIEAEPAR